MNYSEGSAIVGSAVTKGSLLWCLFLLE